MLMRICMTIFALALVAAPVALPAPPPEELDILLYHTSSVTSRRMAVLSVDQSRGENDALPAVVVSKNALVFERFSSLRLPIILDEHGGTDTGHSRLWVDLDGDGELAANEYSEIETADSRWRDISRFEAIVEDGGHRHKVAFHGHCFDFDKPLVRLSSMLAFTGSVQVGEETFAVTVSDGDGDGLLVDDRLQDYEIPAWLTLKADYTNAVPRESYLAPVIALGNECYATDLSFEGTEETLRLRMKLSHRVRERGAVAFSGSDVAAVLLTSSDASLYLDVTNGMVMAPTGTWDVTGIQLTDGSTYRGRISCPDMTIAVTASGAARIDAGGPLKQDVSVHGALSSGNLSLSLDAAKGVGGLTYSPATREYGDRPGWTIRRPGSKTIAQGQFEYG